MNNNKDKINKIREKYTSSGDLIFKSAILFLMECGRSQCADPTWYYDTIHEIDMKYDIAEKIGKKMYMTRDLEKAIVDCVVELANLDINDLFIYIQKHI